MVFYYLKANVFEQVEVLSVESEILHHHRVVYVVGVMIRHREITVAHHLFRGVHYDRTINAATVCFRLFL